MSFQPPANYGQQSPEAVLPPGALYPPQSIIGMPRPGVSMPLPPPGFQPITVQPTAVQTLQNNDGLGYLALVDQLLVHQKVELLEVVTGFETENRYHVRNSLGQNVFYAKETSGCCNRICCGPLRSFEMEIYDNYHREVMHLYRPLACSSCCFPCCLQKLEVFSPPGNIIGTVQQEWSIFFPNFAIKKSNGDTMYRIKGPFWTCSCCCNDVEFKITTADGEQVVGQITKQWSGLVKEAFTNADNFGLTFPMNMDVHMKACVLGACFLIDFMYYETPPDNNHHNNNN